MNLITIHGVRGYIDESGTAQLNVEDISRGLGFIQRKNGVEYVRWERVNSYLNEMRFPQLVGKEYIPENVFYRLSMKGESDSAVSFQNKVADEILPTIRKHGAYMTPETIERTLLNPDFIIGLAGQLKAEQEARRTAETRLEEQRPLVTFAETCLTSDKSVLVREVAKLASKQGVMIGERRLFQKLREWGMFMQHRNEPTQRAMEMGLFEIKKGVYAHPDGARDYATPKVTVRGQVYIIDRLRKEAA